MAFWCRWIKQNLVLVVTLIILVPASAVGLFYLLKFSTPDGPKLIFYDWVWPHQRADREYLSEFEYCRLRPTKCEMSGPRFLVGTFEDGDHYVAHLNVQETVKRKGPIGLVWRLEALVPINLIRREIKSALNFFSGVGVHVEFLVIDYDSPSIGLYAYADWIDVLRSEQLQLPVSVTGLVSWSIDNPDGFELLIGAAEAVSVQLYQGPKRVDLHDNLVMAMERYDNVHISLYCPDTGLLDHLVKKVSISRPLNIGIFNGSSCNNTPR